MAIFTAIAAAIVGAIGITGVVATIATSLIAGGLAFGVSRLIAPRGSSGTTQQEDAISGGRVQLPPATNNKLPVVYGTAFVGGSIIDAKISTDLQTMWYCISLAEVTNTMPGDTPDTITFDQIYYDGKLAALSGAQVTSLSTNTAGGAEVDTKINGNLFVYTFPNGSFSGTNTGGLSAIDIMSDASIPVDQRWNQGIYTAGGQSAAMTNTAFVIVKVKYNQDAGTTALGAVTAKITNARTKPGDCIKDYLLNDRYGCGVPLSSINTASLTALNTYSDKPIVYTPMGGGPTTTQVRYRLNGPLDTTKNCLAILQEMVDACDSWMQYTELTGQWKVVINKAYDETPDAITINDLYSVTNNNLTSGIQVNPTDLNQTFNQVEYQYPNTNIKDQLDFIFIALQDDFPSLLSENEPLNKLTLKNDLVNNYVQAKFIAIRRILQGREDLIITMQTDYSGIQVEAGDIIKVTNEVYGWTNKLFRVSNVVEEKDAEGNLFARLTAFEYNATIYDDDLDITDFIPADNTGLQDPNIISVPDIPIAAVNVSTTLNFIDVSGNVSNVGLVQYLDFNYGFDSNVNNHSFYTSVYNSNGAPLINNQAYSITVNDIPTSGNIYWSTTARNRQVGIQSNSSTAVNWPGANVSSPISQSACNANSTGTLVTTDPIVNLQTGGIISITSGTGNVAANTIVSSVLSNTQFIVNPAPLIALSNACITVNTGGITGNEIQGNTITGNNITANTITLTNLDKNLSVSQGFGGNNFSISGGANITMPVSVTSTSTRNIPVIVPGTTVAATNYYPWYQGTSNISPGSSGNNYYGASSTSSWNPVGASILTINDGEDNWYKILFDDFPLGTIPSNMTYNASWGINMVSDANTTVQLTRGFDFNVGYYECGTDEFDTIQLVANQPKVIGRSFNVSGAPVVNIVSAAVFLRNIVSGTNVTIVKGSIASSKGQIPYY
jgi:hypothetical protein